ncbi:MAG: site-specific recombinase phage integrase family [Gammaproteobacteria bacterium]|jgi:hypothetical protein|nr:site-specific recombinase phage integrase family [Gammaproteobacteria bacterium]
MDRNRFNKEVKPLLTVIPIGSKGVAFDRLDLDTWVDHYKHRNGRPARERRNAWDIKKIPGFTKRYSLWHINKVIDGVRISGSTGTTRLEETEKYLVHRLESIRQAKVYGIRTKRIFREVATKFLLEHRHKKSIKVDA